MESKSFIVIRIYIITVFVLMLLTGVSVYKCCGAKEGNGSDTIKVEKVESHDTIYIEKHDTLPAEKGETIIKYVKVPVYSEYSDTVIIKDSVDMAIVQKQYSDDSSYTAYVSGIRYDDLPKLDSIIVRNKIITNTIKETITIQKKRSHWQIGLQAGYGYGFLYKGFEPYVGVGLAYTIP